jgi:hypothetical protein
MATTLSFGRIGSARPAPPYRCCLPTTDRAAAPEATSAVERAAQPAAPIADAPKLAWKRSPRWLDQVGSLVVLGAILATMALAGAQW